jgi:hypothetical protein
MYQLRGYPIDRDLRRAHQAQRRSGRFRILLALNTRRKAHAASRLTER